MEVNLAIRVSLPDVEIDSIVFDEAGNAEVVLSSGGAQARCHFDATGSDHGTVKAALLFLAGVRIERLTLGACRTAPHAQERPQLLM